MRLNTALATLAAGILAATSLAAAHAEDFTAGAITVVAPWARPSIGETGNSAAYMKVENGGGAADKLMGVNSGVAAHVMIHESRMEDGVMKMRHVMGGIEIPAHGTAELKPLSYHVMLVGLKHPLKAGDKFPMTLTFEKQGDVPIEVTVGQPK
jgi:copper(I)-binding protein